MGKVKDGVIGGFSGKVGPVVGGKGKNGYYVRSLPTGGNPSRSDKQRSARSKFGVAIGLAKMLTPFLRVSYREFAAVRSPFNVAVSCILGAAVVAGEDGPVIDFDRVLVSHGGLTSAEGATAEVTDDKVSFFWADNSDKGNAAGTDVVLLLVYNKELGQPAYDVNAAHRQDGKATLILPDGWKAESLAVYLGFSSADGKMTANSVCLWNG